MDGASYSEENKTFLYSGVGGFRKGNYCLWVGVFLHVIILCHYNLWGYEIKVTA